MPVNAHFGYHMILIVGVMREINQGYYVCHGRTKTGKYFNSRALLYVRGIIHRIDLLSNCV